MTLPPECFPNIHPFWWSGASLSSLVERTFVRISTHPFQAHTLFTFCLHFFVHVFLQAHTSLAVFSLAHSLGGRVGAGVPSIEVSF